MIHVGQVNINPLREKSRRTVVTPQKLTYMLRTVDLSDSCCTRAKRPTADGTISLAHVWPSSLVTPPRARAL